MALAALVIAFAAVAPYTTFNKSMSRIRLDPAFPQHIIVLSLHAISAGVTLLLGPLQFLKWLRTKYPKIHRVIGYTYLSGVFLGSIMAFVSAVVSQSGFTAQVGFLFLDVVWVYTAVQALTAIKRRQFEWHRLWMIRNYSLTFAAVSLRVYLLALPSFSSLTGMNIGRQDVYNVAVWTSIALNFVVAELFIVQPLMQPKTLSLTASKN